MYRGNGSRVIPVILVLIIIAIAIAALVSVGRAIFGGNSTTSPQTDVGHNALINTSADRAVRMTVRGPIVADESFRSYQVTVDSSSRNLTVFSGYLSQTLNFKQYANNSKSYEQFVYALDKANLMQGDALTGASDDTRGICASGDLFEFEVLQSGSTVKRLWTSSCRGSAGSLKASVTQVQGLFLDQIPDNKTLLANIQL
jgi:hypothetical protein